MSASKVKFCDPEPMLQRKAEDRRAFLALPPEEAQRLITIKFAGPPLDLNQEDALFFTDLEGDAQLD